MKRRTFFQALAALVGLPLAAKADDYTVIRRVPVTRPAPTPAGTYTAHDFEGRLLARGWLTWDGQALAGQGPVLATGRVSYVWVVTPLDNPYGAHRFRLPVYEGRHNDGICMPSCNLTAGDTLNITGLRLQ